MSTGVLKLNLTGHNESVRSLDVSKRSPYLFSGSDDHSIKCWDLERNEAIRSFFGHRGGVHSIVTHPSLDIIVSGGRDRVVRVWDIRTRAAVQNLFTHTDSIMSLVCQQTDPQIISGGSDGFICLWDLAAGKLDRRLTRHKKPVRGLTMNTTGRMLISCGADDIRVWDIPSGDFLCTANTTLDAKATEHRSKRRKAEGNGGQKSGKAAVVEEEEFAYRWSACTMSPREVLAVGGADGELAFYDWNTPQPIPVSADEGRSYHFRPYQFTKTKPIPGTLLGEGGINAMVYDFSGTRLITAESDKSIKMWKLQEA
ncbi:unnamed protein product, partial [Phytomonas sp. Hart1]